DGIARRFDTLNAVIKTAATLPDGARAAVVTAAYDELFAPLPVTGQSGHRTGDELDLLFRAASVTASYTANERHVHAMTSILAAQDGRGLAANAEYRRTYEALVAARMLSDAREFARRHPLQEFDALPELNEAVDLTVGRPTEWTVDPHKRALLRRNAALDAVQIVVVSHPLCHFSQAAMRDIQADPVLGEVFRVHAKWLAPPDGSIHFDVVQKWNSMHPHQETTLTYRREEWPMIDSWDTPTFYFIKDGAVAAKLTGWPREGRRAELMDAARQVELL
ncbi:MAG TPA: hypothetical protein VK601_19050, partial [Kofleriaceae bacterium]|nr:hypothetical protein [Kofleriaceae bacterium]